MPRIPLHQHVGEPGEWTHCVWTDDDGERCWQPLTARDIGAQLMAVREQVVHDRDDHIRSMIQGLRDETAKSLADDDIRESLGLVELGNLFGVIDACDFLLEVFAVVTSDAG